MLVTLGQLSESRAKSKPLALTTSLRAKVRLPQVVQEDYADQIISITAERQRISGAGGYIEYGRVNGEYPPLPEGLRLGLNSLQETSLSLALSAISSSRRTTPSPLSVRSSPLIPTLLAMKSQKKMSSSLSLAMVSPSQSCPPFSTHPQLF